MGSEMCIRDSPWPVCEMNDALTSMRDDLGLDIKRLVKAPVNSNKPQVRSLLVAYDDDGDEEQREEQFIEENPVLDTEGRPIFKEGDQLTLEVNAPSDHTHVQLFYIPPMKEPLWFITGNYLTSREGESGSYPWVKLRTKT